LQDGGDDGWLQRIVSAFHSDPTNSKKLSLKPKESTSANTTTPCATPIARDVVQHLVHCRKMFSAGRATGPSALDSSTYGWRFETNDRPKSPIFGTSILTAYVLVLYAVDSRCEGV
jgi:hypothetical protein